MTETPEIVMIGYADRFKWQNAMRAQPKSILSDATKVVLSAILEEMDRKSHITTRTYGHLAKMTGLTKSGARSCADKAEAEGWIKIEGKGGIVVDETGKSNGLANRFEIAVPATAIARFEGDTCYEDGTYLLWNPDLRAMKLVDTCYGHSTNTPLSSPSLPPIASPVAGAGQTDRKEEREQIQSPSLDPSNETERESEIDSETSSTSPTETARASLPIATAAQRATWDGAWPDDDLIVEPISSLAPKETCHRRITYDSLELLGYADNDPAPEGSGVKYRDRWLKALLPDDLVELAAKQKQDGRLRKVDLANMLAALDIAPKAQKRQEAYREA
jgi:hypothetical protein